MKESPIMNYAWVNVSSIEQALDIWADPCLEPLLLCPFEPEHTWPPPNQTMPTDPGTQMPPYPMSPALVGPRSFWTPLQKIHLLNEFLSSHVKDFGDSAMWHKFVNEFFTPDAYLSISLPSEGEPAEDHPHGSYSISRPLIPRFFHTWAESGLTGLHLIIEKIKETFLPNNLLLLDSPRIKMISTLHGGQQLVEHTGSLRMLFCPTSKIQFLELSLTGFEQFLNSKCDSLFTLPLQSGFDPALHQFLSMLVLVQTSFNNFETMTHMPSLDPEHSPSFNTQPMQQPAVRLVNGVQQRPLLPKPSPPPSPGPTSPPAST